MARRLSLPISGVAAAIAAAAVLLLPQAAATSNVAATESTQSAQPTYVFRVASAAANAEKLFGYGFDVLEERDGNDLFVLGNAGEGDRLRAAGFTVSTETAMAPPKWAPPKERASNDRLTAADADETYYGGYHTVNAQYAHMDQAAQQHPDLVKTVTYGQSWLKTNGQGGYDLRAICVTKLQSGDCSLNPNSTKPHFFLMAQIHAREITTGDVAYRWIDYLVNGYGTDSTVTSLLNSGEMWVVPIANPDGVDIVQQGGDSPNLQRKNADTSNGGSCGFGGQIGVDLNRNYGTHFGGASTSSDPCGEVYKGPAADSEVENTSMEKLFRELWPARRTGTGVTDPAPADTKGLMMTMHSDASVVIFPWGYSSSVHTGNDASLRAIGKKLGSITGYPYGQAGQVLYNASGSTDDWAYDKLGVASFTVEVGDNTAAGCGGFLPAYSCQDSLFWPKMQPALIYAAQHAATPYQTK
jgi:carboxypeptidase T